MTNKEFAGKLERRTVDFAVDVIRLSVAMSGSPEALIIRNQLTRSATSVGANYREANRARSKRDFRNKIKISEGEASETVYWLTILERLDWLEKKRMKKTMKEAKEILAIFSTISGKL